MDYYLTVRMNNVLIPAMANELKNLILRGKKKQTKKTIYCMTALTQNVKYVHSNQIYRNRR
jgi:uncharacterized protein YhfF